jgi:iron complex transport system permease protein
MKRKQVISLIAVILLLILAFIVSAITGSLRVTPLELISGLLFGGHEQVEIIKDLRFPRIIIAIFAGAALSVSGLLLQAVMRNPLADPGIIGVSAGASFMSLLMATLLPTLYFFTPLFAFLGGALGFFLVYALSWRGGLNPLRMVLIGIAIHSVFSGLAQALGMQGSSLISSLTQMNSTLSMKTWSEAETLVICGSIGLVLALLVSRWCNYLALEDKTARNLGLNVNLMRFVISMIAVLLAAVATSVAGVFAFVGLLVPHIGRLLVGSDHRILTPFSILAGAALILIADTVGRALMPPHEIPASIIMAVIGGPVLIILLRKSERIYGN